VRVTSPAGRLFNAADAVGLLAWLAGRSVDKGGTEVLARAQASTAIRRALNAEINLGFLIIGSPSGNGFWMVNEFRHFESIVQFTPKPSCFYSRFRSGVMVRRLGSFPVLFNPNFRKILGLHIPQR
jgi:hypothetical protein